MSEYCDGHDGILVASADCTQQLDLCFNFPAALVDGRLSFPQFIYGDPDSDKAQRYTGGTDYDSLSDFVKNLTPGPGPSPGPSPGPGWYKTITPSSNSQLCLDLPGNNP